MTLLDFLLQLLNQGFLGLQLSLALLEPLSEQGVTFELLLGLARLHLFDQSLAVTQLLPQDLLALPKSTLCTLKSFLLL